MARLGELADEQTPLLADVQNARRPPSNELITPLGPFAQRLAPRAALARRRLRRRATGPSGRAREEVAELQAAGQRTRRALAKPLRQYLQTIDDRERAIENDPRAKAGGPPAPDPTAIPADGQGGFTGHGGVLELLLLAEPVAQRLRRREPHPARSPRRRRSAARSRRRWATRPTTRRSTATATAGSARPAGHHDPGLHARRRRPAASLRKRNERPAQPPR